MVMPRDAEKMRVCFKINKILLMLEFIKENKKVRKQENTPSTKKAMKKKEKK